MEIKRVPIKVAAAIMGTSSQFIRCGLQHDRLPFGVAVTRNPKARRPVYCYHISPRLFKDYTGCTDADIISTAKDVGSILK